MRKSRFIYLNCALLLSFSILGLLATKAQTSLLEEQFDLPAGALIRDHGWYAHSAASTNPLAVSGPGLFWTQTPYRGSGQGLSLAVNNTGSDENRPFSTNVDTGSVYSSFLFKVEGAVDSSAEGYFFHYIEYNSVTTPVYTSVATAHRARTYLVRGDTPATFRLGLAFNSASVPSNQGIDLTGPLDIGITYLAVLKYEVIPGADNDIVSLYLFEDGDSIAVEPLTPTLGPLTGTARDLTAIQGIAWRQYSSSQSVRVDGLYSARNWNLVSSNPGAFFKPSTTFTFKTYPNPATAGKLRVEFPDEQLYLIEMMGIDGMTKYQWQTNSLFYEIDGLNPGLYILRAQKQDGQNAYQKIWVP
jgi:hypothetical protein